MAILYLHSNDIIHRDLKVNIFYNAAVKSIARPVP